MASVAAGRAALDAGRLDEAQSIFLSTYDNAPGPSSRGLAEVALARGDAQRAENIARAAMENGEQSAVIVLAEAIGAQGRRAEAEAIAATAVEMFPHEPFARAVLGEQLIRQARWDEGAQRFIEAIALDHAGATSGYLHRLLGDLADAHLAKKVPTQVVTSFLDRLEPGAAGHGELRGVITEARRAISTGSAMQERRSAPAKPTLREAAVGAPAPPLPPSAGSEPRRSASGSSVPPKRGFVQQDLPALLEVMQLGRAMGGDLEALVIPMGLPEWPSEIEIKLDDMPRMRPSRLNFTEEGLKRTTLKLTSGSVASEILIERALENLLRACEVGSSTRPTFDGVGMTKLETALWDGALDRIKPVPEVYGEVTPSDYRILALGGFLGDGILRLTDSTWKFHDNPVQSVVEVDEEDLRPFATASAWLAAADWDDVHLEEIVGRALLHGGKGSQGTPRIDPTRDLTGKALSRKLAEQWMAFRGHPAGISQTDVSEGIRPLNILDEIVFFACDVRFVPPFALGPNGRARINDEVSLAYIRKSGEFLCLASRKHFARAAGQMVGELSPQSAKMVLDLYTTFHRPQSKVEWHGPAGPRVEQRGPATALTFNADGRRHALTHAPGAPVPWRFSIESPSRE